MKHFAYILFFLSTPLLFAETGEKASPSSESALIPATTAIGSALVKPDVALAKSWICGSTQTKGLFGETLVESNKKDIIGKYLNRNNAKNWVSISPRTGSQGLDHVWVKFDSKGRKIGLLIGETKYESSRLGKTKLGTQMSQKWISDKLKRLSDIYKQLYQTTEIAKMPFSPYKSIEIPLGDGKFGTFWTDKKGKNWKYDGPPGTFNEAKSKTNSISTFLEKYANSNTYRARIFNVTKVNGNDVVITTYDASDIPSDKRIPIRKLRKIGKPIRIEGVLKDGTIIPRKDLIKTLRTQYPSYTLKEISVFADEIAEAAKNGELLNKYPMRKVIEEYASESAKIAMLAMGIDLAFQAYECDFDYKQNLLVSTSAFIGMETSQMLNASMVQFSRTKIGQKLCGSLLSRGFNSAVSTAVGAGVTDFLLAYGRYYMGYTDLNTANREAFIGLASTMIASGAYFAITSAVSTWGMASTGTAITSLHGAAATSAINAWFAGGSIASGGGGAAIGSAILGGAIVIVAVVSTIAIYKLYAIYDEHKYNEDLRTRIDFFMDCDNLQKVVDGAVLM